MRKSQFLGTKYSEGKYKVLGKIIKTISVTTSKKKRFFLLSWFFIIPFIYFLSFIPFKAPIQAIQVVQASEQVVVSNSFDRQSWYHIAQTDPNATGCVSCHNTTAITAVNCTECHDGIFAMEAPDPIGTIEIIDFLHHDLVDPSGGMTCNDSGCHGGNEDYRFVITMVGNHTYCDDCHTIGSPCNDCHDSSNPMNADLDVQGASTPNTSFFTGPIGLPALIIFIAIPLSAIYYFLKM